MRHLHDRDAVFTVELLEELHDLAALIRVQIAGGLVGQDERGLGDQRARHADKLLLAAGELIGIEVFFPDDLKAVEHVAHDALALLLRHVAVAEGNLQILVDREIVEQVIALEDEADVFFLQIEAFFLLQLVDGVAAEPVFALPRTVMQTEDVEQGRFARTRGAHDRYEFTLADFEVDVAEGVERTAFQRIHAVDVTECDHGRAWRWMGMPVEADGPAGGSD